MSQALIIILFTYLYYNNNNECIGEFFVSNPQLTQSNQYTLLIFNFQSEN